MTNSIHDALRFLLISATFLGFFPVHRQHKKSKFMWCSLKTLHSLLLLLFSFLMTLSVVATMIVTKNASSYMTLLIYCSSQFLGIAFFIKLAHGWSSWMQIWEDVENKMGKYAIKVDLSKKCNIILLVFALLKSVNFFGSYLYLLIAVFRSTGTILKMFEYYAVKVFLCSHVFKFVQYNPWTGIPIMVTYVLVTFVSFFVDLLLLIMCIALAVKLEQLRNKVKVVIKAKVRRDTVWRHLREEHFLLCQLCHVLNEKLVNLSAGISSLKNVIKGFVYLLSVGYLIGRMICICVYGSAISEMNTVIGEYLLSVSSSLYSFEIQRFTDQVLFTKVAITGKCFFTVSKSSIFKITGAAVTYELILMHLKSKLIPNFDNESGGNRTSNRSG